jgi:hypothetical protein
MKGQRRFERGFDHSRRGAMRVRSGATVLAITALAVGLGGCLSIKTQSASQRAPGVFTLNITVCASDRDRNIYPDCDPATDGNGAQNTAEQDSGQDAIEGEAIGQILAGFRVPSGTRAPDGFFSAAQEVFFSKSPTYTTQLNTEFPPAEGLEWVGYLSTAKLINVDDAFSRVTTFQPEFTLPVRADGQPLADPIFWRAVVALRTTQPNAPVTCTGSACSDSPPTARVPINLSAPVSDFGVLSGGTTQAGHGETATVTFPVRYLDGNNLGAQVFSVSATTTMPSTNATTSVATVGAIPNSTNTVNVSVPVPPGTPLGTYTVTFSAAVGDPAVTRTNTATIQVVDKLAPAVRISTPAEGARILHGRRVLADFACTEELNGTGLQSCSGPVSSGTAINTRSLGTKSFTVNATDNAGNAASLTRTYTVVPRDNPATLSRSFARFPTNTVLTRLEVKNVPAGSRVKATCKFKKKKCPRKARKAFTKRNARGTVALKKFTRVPLRPGTKITVRVTKPGFIGAVKILTIRKGKDPSVTDRCLPPGAKKPVAC